MNLAIKSFNLENAFNGKGITSQVELFNKSLMNIFSNFIPNKIKTFRDSDSPWMNDDIKSKIKLQHKFYHNYLTHKSNHEDFAKLEYLRNEIDNLISKSNYLKGANSSKGVNSPILGRHSPFPKVCAMTYKKGSCAEFGPVDIFQFKSDSVKVIIIVIIIILEGISSKYQQKA